VLCSAVVESIANLVKKRATYLLRGLRDMLTGDTLGWLSRILGLAITASAASLGPPFWFDVLNRVGSLRNVGNKPKSDTS
jgi:hypothetical protein